MTKPSGKAVLIFQGAVVALLLIVGAGIIGISSCGISAPKPPTAAWTAPITTNATVTIPCHDAPSVIVDLINASFTDGEQLVNTQSVDGPNSMTYVGGDIDKDGSRVSSRDVWLLSDGVVYALSSDARRRTLLPDGRDLASAGDEYSTELANCVSPTMTGS